MKMILERSIGEKIYEDKTENVTTPLLQYQHQFVRLNLPWSSLLLVSSLTGGHMLHPLREQFPHLWQQMLHFLHPQF